MSAIVLTGPQMTPASLRTASISAESWAAPHSAMMTAISSWFSPRLRQLVGYGVYNGLIGHIDKQSPERLLDDGGRDPGVIWDQYSGKR